MGDWAEGHDDRLTELYLAYIRAFRQWRHFGYLLAETTPEAEQYREKREGFRVEAHARMVRTRAALEAELASAPGEGGA